MKPLKVKAKLLDYIVRSQAEFVTKDITPTHLLVTEMDYTILKTVPGLVEIVVKDKVDTLFSLPIVRTARVTAVAHLGETKR